MTSLCRSHSIRFLIFFALILATASCSQKSQPVAEKTAQPQGQGLTIEQVAKAYGLDSFGQVEAIRYTWNAQFPGVNVSRSWIWEPIQRPAGRLALRVAGLSLVVRWIPA